QMQAGPVRARYWVLEVAGQPHGLMSLVVDPDGEGAETGVLLDAAGRRRGIATAALGGLMARVFGTRPRTGIWTRHRPSHQAARALMVRLGFEAEGRFDPQGLQRWRMSRARWLARGAANDGLPDAKT